MSEILRKYLLDNKPKHEVSENMLTPSQMMHRVVDSLGINVNDVSKMFGVGHQAARRLIDGHHTQTEPSDAAMIYDAYDAVRLMSNVANGITDFSTILRKEAQAFNGKSPLYWIKQGRMEDVAVDFVEYADINFDIYIMPQKTVDNRYPLKVTE